jgi:hypothetical protein
VDLLPPITRIWRPLFYVHLMPVHLPMMSLFCWYTSPFYFLPLQGFIVGERARYWGTRTQLERKEAILKEYERLFETPEALNAIDFVEKNWLEEEFSRGCFVGLMSPGTMTSCGKALREPVGRIFWAGTETAEVW